MMNLVSWHLWILLEAGVLAGVVVALGAVVRWGRRRAARHDADRTR
jgi:hypothetical protein